MRTTARRCWPQRIAVVDRELAREPTGEAAFSPLWLWAQWHRRSRLHLRRSRAEDRRAGFARRTIQPESQGRDLPALRRFARVCAAGRNLMTVPSTVRSKPSESFAIAGSAAGAGSVSADQTPSVSQIAAMGSQIKRGALRMAVIRTMASKGTIRQVGSWGESTGSARLRSLREVEQRGVEERDQCGGRGRLRLARAANAGERWTRLGQR